MTHAERKALREKHLNLTTADGQFCVGCALISGRATYLDGLCDTIKVLDALENSDITKLGTKQNYCNHQHIGISHVDLDGVEEWFEHYAYCPKCGEKL